MAHPKGGYKNAAGKRVPGVTTIIGRFKDSGALLWWAFGQGKAAERGEIEKLYDKRDEAAESGTLAHEMVEAHINGDPQPQQGDTPIEIFSDALTAYKAYLKWANQSKLEIVEQEIQMVSEEYQFGGCPDAIGMIDGELSLVDWKTSKAVYPDYMIQVAAYALLWGENYPDRPITGGYHLCRFSKTGGDFSHHYWSELQDAKQQFILFRQAYDLDKKIKARCG